MSVLPSLSCSNADLIAVAVPSGQPVSLLEVLLDEQPGAVWARFRFIAPGIGHDAEDVASDQAVGDMDHLCNTLALPYLRENVLEAERIVISFSDRVVAFGASDPDATQFFELYSAGPDGCVWEGF